MHASLRGSAQLCWRWLLSSWPVLSVAAIAWTLWLAPQPTTWRRPVRDEFWRAAQLAGPGSLTPIVIAAALIGVALVGQGVFWLEAVGQREVIETTLLVILIREVTPIVVGLVVLGCTGLVSLGELGAMRAAGTVRTIEAQGLDPLILFVLPRVLALGLTTFVHAVAFLIVAVVVGHYAAAFLGVGGGDVWQSARLSLRVMGEVGVFVLPLKTVLIGFAVGAITSVMALRGPDDRPDPDLMPRGFFAGLFAVFIVSLVVSVAL